MRQTFALHFWIMVSSVCLFILANPAHSQPFQIQTTFDVPNQQYSIPKNYFEVHHRLFTYSRFHLSLWDLLIGQIIWEWTFQKPISHVVMSPDQKQLAVGLSHARIDLYSIQNPDQVLSIPLDGWNPKIEYSVDSMRLLITTEDDLCDGNPEYCERYFVINAQDGSVLKSEMGDYDESFNFTWLNRYKILFSYKNLHQNLDIVKYDTMKKAYQLPLEEFFSPIYLVDREYHFMVMSEPNEIQIYRGRDGELVSTQKILDMNPKRMEVIDGRSLIYIVNDVLKIRDAESGDLVHTCKSHTKPITDWIWRKNHTECITWSSSSVSLVDPDYQLILWNMPAGTKKHTIDLEGDYVQKVLLSPDEQFLCTITQKRNLRIYRLEDPYELLIEKPITSKEIYRFEFISPTEPYILFIEYPYGIQTFQLGDTIKTSMLGLPGNEYRAVMLPHTPYILTYRYDGCFYIRNIETAEYLVAYCGYFNPIDSKMLSLTLSMDSSIKANGMFPIEIFQSSTKKRFSFPDYLQSFENPQKVDQRLATIWQTAN